VYSLSEDLVKAVERALIGLHQFRLAPAAPPQKASEEWNRFVTMISKVERAIFPKEEDASCASVRLSEKQSEVSIFFQITTASRTLLSAMEG
jgi:hypothetical protein